MRRRLTLAGSFSICALALLASGCAPSLRVEPSAMELEAWAEETSQRYLIGPRDLLSISVWRQPELSVDQVEVRLDGKIGVPLLDDVHAAGLTTNELKAVITKRLGEFVVDPTVTVVVKESRSKVVYVMGEVLNQGALPLQSDMRVIDAIAMAGGFSEFSDKKRVTVIREHNGSPQELRFNYDAYLRGSDLERNILLLPGDRIIVPEESPLLLR